jgi:hypothetical protein
MAEDDVLRQVRAAREAYARSLGYDVRAMVAELRARDAAGDWPVVRRPARRCGPALVPPTTPTNPLPQKAAS